MTVSRRGVTTAVSPAGTDVTSIDIAVPADVVEGEMLVVFTSSATGTTPPAGWNLIGFFRPSGSSLESTMYRRFASASEPASYTWNFTNSGPVAIAMIAFSGANDIHIWDGNPQTGGSYSICRRTAAARDSLAYSVCAWRDSATNTITPSQGLEDFDVVTSGSGGTVYRGMSAVAYGVNGNGDVTDIVNVGDTLPPTFFTPSSGSLDYAVCWQFLVDAKVDDPEPWSETAGDFAVDLDLDPKSYNPTGGISSPFKGDLTGLVAAVTASGENAPNETAAMAADGLSETKWLVFNFAPEAWIQYDFGVTKQAKRYRLVSGNDSRARDPRDWTVQGSNNGTDWDVLDTRTGEAFGSRRQSREFVISTPGEYRYYRLSVTANYAPATTTTFQLAEFRLSAHDDWENITDRVVAQDKIRITRGLQSSSGRSDFSRAYYNLDNRDGLFSLRNPDSPYYGSLQRNTVTRISKAYGPKLIQLQGAVRVEGTDMCGDGFRMPLDHRMVATGDIDIRLDVWLESWRDEQMLAGVATSTTDLFSPVTSWAFWLDSDGRLNWRHSDGSNVLTYRSTVAVPQGDRKLLRVVLDADNGSSGSTVTFYAGQTGDPDWTLLGEPVTKSGTTSINYVGGALCVGHVPGYAQRGIHGKVYAFGALVGGATVSTWNAFTQDNAVYSFPDSSFTQYNRHWVAVNNAILSNRQYRFHGEVSEWPLAWDTTGTWITESVTGAGIQKRMERGGKESSAFYRHHTKGIIENPGAFERWARPAAYWPMEDGANSTRAAAAVPGKPFMEIYGKPEFESLSDFEGSAPLPKMNKAKFGGRVVGNHAHYADVRWVMYVPPAETDVVNIPNDGIMVTCYGSGLTNRLNVVYDSANTWYIEGFGEDDSGSFAFNSGNFSVTTVGKYLYCQMILTDDGTGLTGLHVTLNCWDPYGANMGGFDGGFATSAIGRVYRVNLNDGESTKKMQEAYMGHVAVYADTDAPSPLAALNGSHYERAVDRLKRLCAEENVEFRWIGAADGSAMMGFQDTESVFQAMSTCAVSDDGFLVDPLDAFGIEYRTVRSLYNQPARLTLSYTGNELSGSMTPTSDDSYIQNDFTASRGAASSHRAQMTEGPLSISDPPDGVGFYTSSQSYSLAADGQTVDMATWQVSKGTLDEDRYPAIQLALENIRIAASTEQTIRILSLDVGARVDVTDTPDFLPAEDIRQVVIGYQEEFDLFTHDFSLNTLPERVYEVAEYDQQRSMDTAGSSLYGDIDATQELVLVSSDTGKWTDDVAAYPFDWKVDGEVIRAVAPGRFITPNPFFDTDLAGWSMRSSTIARSELRVNPHPVAVASMQITPDGANVGGATQDVDQGVAVTAQNPYVASAWFYSDGTVSDVRATVEWYDATDTLLSQPLGTSVSLTPGKWVFHQQELVAPAGAVKVLTRIRHASSETQPYFVWNAKVCEAVCGRTGYVNQDSFNRADNASAIGTPDGELYPSPTWTVASGTWGISANRAYMSAAGTGRVYTQGFTELDLVYVDIPVLPASQTVYLMARFADASNYIAFGGTTGSPAQVVIQSGGSAVRTVIADDNSGLFTMAAGMRLALRIRGTVIEAYVNGRVAACFTDDTNTTGSGVGFLTTSTTARFDNLYIEGFTPVQPVTVERGINNAARPHKNAAPVSLLLKPTRGL